MAEMSVSGIASGIDWDSIVEKLLEKASKPAYVQVTKRDNLELKKTLWEELRVSMQTLQSALSPLKLASTFKAKQVEIERLDSSGSYKGVLTAFVNSDAEIDVHDLQVVKLAKSQVNRSIQFATATTNLSSVIGFNNSYFYVTAGGKKIRIDVASSDNLSGVADKVNTALKTQVPPIAVTASVVDNRLVLKSDNTGLGQTSETLTGTRAVGVNNLDTLDTDVDLGALNGGMPEVVATYAHGGSLLECQQVLDDLTLSLYADFSKYKERMPASRLREVFAAVIYQTGGKFTYSKASQDLSHLQVKESLELLELAGIIYPITHTSANGLPLAAEMNTKYRKFLIFDTGIYQRFLRLDLGQLFAAESLDQINKGALAELFVGLELLKSAPSNYPMQLYYWRRDKPGSAAEVDYVIQRNSEIVPIEVKSGTKGSMQSMFQFLSEKNYKYGIRCSTENFGAFQSVNIYPLYAVSQI